MGFTHNRTENDMCAKCPDPFCRCDKLYMSILIQPPLLIQVGKTYVDGEGRKVLILHKLDGTQPWYVGAVKEGTREKIRYYSNTGGHAFYVEGNRDLMKEYVEPEYRWFNVFKSHIGAYYQTKANALTASANYVGWLGLYRIDPNTGEITKED